MKQLNLYYLGGGGGGSVPDGKTVTPINDVTIWQQCAGIANPTYTTIVEILADTGILQTLMADNNAVDYLVRSKYFIGSASGLVPIMTNNTTPSGVVSAKTAINPAYKAFDGDDTTYWNSNTLGSVSEGSWIQYAFDNPVVVNKVGFKPYSVGAWKKYYIAASNDGVTWTQVTEEQTVTSADMQYLAISGSTPYLYWRAVNTLIEGSLGSTTPTLYTLQFYNDGVTSNSDAMYYVGQNNYCSDTLLADATWRNAIQNSAYFKSVYNVYNPIMTSNTTPSGVVSSKDNFMANPWKAMDGDDTTKPSSNISPFTNATRIIIYEFDTPMCITLIESFVYTEAGGGYGAAQNKVQYEISNDGVNWTTIYIDTDFSNRTTKRMIDCNSNTVVCKYVAVSVIGNNYSWNCAVPASNYYGREDV